MPPQVCDLPQQVARLYRGFSRQSDDIAKYQYLRAMQERSEVRFHAMLQDHLEAPDSRFPETYRDCNLAGDLPALLEVITEAL